MSDTVDLVEQLADAARNAVLARRQTARWKGC